MDQRSVHHPQTLSEKNKWFLYIAETIKTQELDHFENDSTNKGHDMEMMVVRDQRAGCTNRSATTYKHSPKGSHKKGKRSLETLGEVFSQALCCLYIGKELISINCNVQTDSAQIPPEAALRDLEADPKILEPESWKHLPKTAGTKSRAFELAEQELR